MYIFAICILHACMISRKKPSNNKLNMSLLFDGFLRLIGLQKWNSRFEYWQLFTLLPSVWQAWTIHCFIVFQFELFKWQSRCYCAFKICANKNMFLHIHTIYNLSTNITSSLLYFTQRLIHLFFTPNLINCWRTVLQVRARDTAPLITAFTVLSNFAPFTRYSIWNWKFLLC